MHFWSRVHMLPLTGKQILKCQKKEKYFHVYLHILCAQAHLCERRIFLWMCKIEQKKHVMKRIVLIYHFLPFLHNPHKSCFFLKPLHGHLARTWRCVHNIFVWILLTFSNMLKMHFKLKEHMHPGFKAPYPSCRDCAYHRDILSRDIKCYIVHIGDY
jgi:hypothetical protein